MNTYWIIAALVAIVVFAIGERYAFAHPTRQNTLSRSIYDIGRAWPLSIFIMGMFAGGLAVHFFWHWCPDLMPPGVNGLIYLLPDSVFLTVAPTGG